MDEKTIDERGLKEHETKTMKELAKTHKKRPKVELKLLPSKDEGNRLVSVMGVEVSARTHLPLFF